MAKKVKKNARSGQKDKRGLKTPETVSEQCTSDIETPDDGAAVVKHNGTCSHIDRGINLDKLSAKLEPSESVNCEDCRGNAVDKRAKKGKVKHGKKLESKAIWVCLECGHFSCGGVGLPNTPQSHAIRHAKLKNHPLMVNYENHRLLWCLPCSKLISAEKCEDKRHKEILDKVVKLLKGKPADEKSNADVEDVWFGSGSVTSAIKLDYSTKIAADGKVGCSIRGLVNLGNTCFFNSIMQNLLAINRLRDYFFKSDESVGPLSAALRKLFLETGSEAGSKGVINPRSLFGSLCTKAPQFRGYQQHDSHELLRCLLDSLSTEELSAKKHIKSSEASSITDPTFVDSIFGGKLSSTVSCLECGHSSTIYEPFLDLSLPVPTKKPPPSKKIQPVTRGKKPKLPPKRSGRNLSKIRREPRESVTDQSTVANSSDEVQSSIVQPAVEEQLVCFSGDSELPDAIVPNGMVQPAEQLVLFSGDSELSDVYDLEAVVQPAEQLVLFWGDTVLSDAFDPYDTALDMGLTPENPSAFQKPKNQQEVEMVGLGEQDSFSFSWLDYLDELDTVSHDNTVASETDGISVIPDFANEDVFKNDVSFSMGLDTNTKSDLTTSSDNAKQLNAHEPGILAEQQNAFSKSEDNQNVNAQSSEKLTPDDPTAEEIVQCDIGHSSKDLNTSEIDNNEKNPQVQNSEVMSVPEKEDGSSIVELPREENIEVSSVVVGDEQDFDGIGDLFNEPEVASDITTKNGVTENSSDSDPNEVDNADAPVSVESCMAFFTKPELLSKDEHAWQCDNCSKILREQKIKSRKKFLVPRPKIVRNGLLDVEKTYDKTKSTNGNVEKDEKSLTQNMELSDNNGNACHDQSDCSSSNYQKLNNPSSGIFDSHKDGVGESEVSSDEEEEVVSGNLKVKRDATKSILINKAPSILTIHLKRFSQDARGRLSKLNGHVNFRETIDLKPYMDPRFCEGDSRGLKYRLVGVVEHLGSMRGGHYVAYVRGTKNGGCTWYNASDSHVHEVSFAEVTRCEAYILFYEGTC